MSTANPIITFLMLLLMLGNNSNVPVPQPTEIIPTSRIVLGVAQIGAESEWRVANTESIKEAAAEAGIELKFANAQQIRENQIKAIRSFIAQKVDVIAITPVVETGWDTVLSEAKDAGIPVILMDRTIITLKSDLYPTYLGNNFCEEGEKAASWLMEFMKDKTPRNGGDKFNIVELQGTVGSDPAIDRKKGFEETIDTSKYEITKSQTAEFTRAKGKEVMEAFLKADKDNIDILFAHNDDMAMGAIYAIEEAGLRSGQDIYIVSIDGTKGAFEAMIAGKLNCTVECSPDFGPKLMELVTDIVAGREVPGVNYVDESVFPAEVAGEVLPYRRY